VGLEDVQRGLEGEDERAREEHRRVITAQVGDLILINAYVVNGESVESPKYAFKLAWLELLAAHVEALCDPSEKVVLTGDFNCTFDDRDVYDPERWRGKNLCSEPERAAFRKLLDWGFTDALRLYTQEPEIYTWWDYRQGMFWRNQGLRIDHHLITAPLTLRLDGVEVRRELRKGEKPSDHVAVVALLD
jgi:exodeoxyribonuclease-3